MTFEIIATAPPGINGDYNANGKVDAADYAVWRKYVSTTTYAAERSDRRHDRRRPSTTLAVTLRHGGPVRGSGLGDARPGTRPRC